MSNEASLPAIHILHLLEVARRWQVSGDELLDGLDLEPQSLSLPGLRLPMSTVCTIIERAHDLTGEPALGVYLGLQMKASWHGFLGFAAMSAETVGDALRLAARFAATRTSALGLDLEVEGDVATLVVEEKASLGSARETLLLSLVIGFAQIGAGLIGRPTTGRVEFAFEEPAYMTPFRASLPDMIAFGRPRNTLSFDAAELEVPMPLADAGALELARQQCEQELSALARESDVIAAVRDAIGEASREEIARRLGMSPRTLKRRLAAAGTTFSELVSDKRRAEAFALLRTRASIEEVAEKLGYADSQSFARAFRRWTGMSPTAFRKNIDASE